MQSNLRNLVQQERRKSTANDFFLIEELDIYLVDFHQVEFSN